jgi:CheY-like chemotaxis protein
MPERSILVVDDEPLILRITQITLTKTTDWRVLTARSGGEALEVAKTKRPDAILLDAMMPGLDGLATLSLLRALETTASIPVIFLTADLVASRVAGFLQRGAIGVLAKPFEPDKLGKQIDQLLGQHQGRVGG